MSQSIHEIMGSIVFEHFFRYKILTTRRGGMAIVYLLRRLQPEKLPASSGWPEELAAKTFDETEEFKSQFERELNIWIDLKVPNTVPLLSVTRVHGQLFALMPCYECSLSDVLSECGRVAPRAALGYMASAAVCLSAAYDRHRALHLDLKPSNLLLLRRQHGDAHVSDWGIAQILYKRLPPEQRNCSAKSFVNTLDLAGTLPYMSAQRLLGQQPETEDDIYSLGLILCELLTGAHPVQGSPDDAVRSILDGTYHKQAEALMHGAEDGLKRLVLRCIAPNRAERFHTYRDLIEAIRRCQHDNA